MILINKLPQLSRLHEAICPQQLSFRTVSGLTLQTLVPTRARTPPTRAPKPPAQALPMERPVQGRRLALEGCLVATVLGGLLECGVLFANISNMFLAEAEQDFCFH